jgi:choline dehydrogenase-like flavoprotein
LPPNSRARFRNPRHDNESQVLLQERRSKELIEDFNNFENQTSVSSDVCIIGAGAAGIALAREFLGTHHTVTLLESGGLHREPESHRLYESEVAGLPHTGIHAGRERVFGGTTTTWGGQALRFDEFDLQPRPWVPFSGWPLSCKDLEPYYERAGRVLRLGDRFNYDELCSSFGVAAPAFDSQKLRMEFSQWSPKPNFGTAYRQDLKRAANISVLLHANVTAIVTNCAGSAVEQIEFSTLAGKKGVAHARFFVICCGGIETARLLLASDRVQSSGVGNEHDVVGRYFQEHVFFGVGQLVTAHRRRLQELYESFWVGGLKYAPLVTLAQGVQAEKQLLSIHGIISFEPSPDSCIRAAKTLFRAVIGRTYPNARELKRLLHNILSDLGELSRLAYRRIVQKRAGTPKDGTISLTAQSEMAPNPDSRVMLSDARDQLGMRRAKLDWRLGELERRTIFEFTRITISEFERLGLGTFDRSRLALLEDAAAWVHEAHDSFHHMGATRMHEDPKLGVVDSNCRVHGVANLYIGSSSVFPTSARSNPTLTILALCLRIADRLKQLS